MFGGTKFNKNSEFLRNAFADKTGNTGAGGSVNDAIFQGILMAEGHSKNILQTGQTQYIPGIKQNILDMVVEWVEQSPENIFTLYGKMGCGKSYFSARLYELFRTEKKECHVIAFSSQQVYRDTTVLRNALLSIAHQLFDTVPACTEHFKSNALDAESIEDLTEAVLLAPFDNATLQKNLLIVMDGLDEYPKADCIRFLETLSRLRSRINPNVKLFFSSRPENYIMSEMLCPSDKCCYHIEKNTSQSNEDCLCFIDAKCRKLNLHLDHTTKDILVEKSESSLKYLECFFNDVSFGSVSPDQDFIKALPRGLSLYYRDQLVRYFADESLDFYRTKIVPLLELLCVASRPITIDEACDILGWHPSDITDVISRSGTLLWRNNSYVMLYQSESVREFLIDERYCPEKYQIDTSRGTERILNRLKSLMDSGEDIESNMYLFDCIADHIIGNDRISPAEWALVIRLNAHYMHKSDLAMDLTKRIFEKSVEEILSYIRHVYQATDLDPILQDYACVRIVAHVTKPAQAEKLSTIIQALGTNEPYAFFVTYAKAKILRLQGKDEDVVAMLAPHLGITCTDLIALYRQVYYLDFLCRIQKKAKNVPWEEITRNHIRSIEDSEIIRDQYSNQITPMHLVLLRNLSVSYDQLAILCELLESVTEPQARIACGQQLLRVLKLRESDPAQAGFFFFAAETCYKEQLNICKLCQQFDSFSDGRVYDLHYPFYKLGILHFREDFPGNNPDKAHRYFDDCLSSIMDIATRAGSDEKYIKVPIDIYKKLSEIYLGKKDFAAARRYLAEEQKLRELRTVYFPSASNEFDKCICLERMAGIYKDESGIDAAESYYLDAIKAYEACARKYDDFFIQRSAYVVYHNLSNNYFTAANWQKVMEYSEKALEELRRLKAQFPDQNMDYYHVIALLHLTSAYSETDAEGTYDKRMGLYDDALALLEGLVETGFEQKHCKLLLSIYHTVFQDAFARNAENDILSRWDRILYFCRDIASRYPTLNTLHLPLIITAKRNRLMCRDEIDAQLLTDCRDYLKYLVNDLKIEALRDKWKTLKENLIKYDQSATNKSLYKSAENNS